ncbi:MAG TPA: Gfo/Idh/MocA family oxidoreductase, partial [Sphingobacterium sp.]|nr:Gfo/Idh/MocA family oxidoreductase [Sphingobacterium sp.]
TVDAIKAGKHVYLEKTMTHNMAQADQLCSIADQHPEIVIQIGHQYRYFQLYHQVLTAINEDWIGEGSQYECQYHRNADWRRPVADPKLERQINWRMYKDLSGGLMTELCAHQIDILNWFTNAHPVKVSAMGGIDYWRDGRETYDNIRAIFEYPAGIRASVSSILGNSYNGYSIRVLGTKGTIIIQQGKAFVYPENTKRELGNVDGVTGATKTSWGQGEAIPLSFDSIDGLDREPTTYALLDFARCVHEGDVPFSNVYTGRLSAKSAFMANAAAERNEVIFWNKFS